MLSLNEETWAGNLVTVFRFAKRVPVRDPQRTELEENRDLGSK